MISYTPLVQPFLPRTVVLGMVFLLAGCVSQITAPLHSVVTKNVGNTDIKQVQIHYAPPIVFQALTPRKPGSQQVTIGDNPIPEVMKVKWILEDGRNFEQDVLLQRHIPIIGKLRGIEILFNGPSLEVIRAMQHPQYPLESVKERIYPR